MVLNFMTNDFIIIWNLLFGASISSESQDFKTTVWKKYRKQYESLQNDQRMMIRNIKNFIPDDDTIYNLALESKMYEKIKKDADKHRIFLMQVWDKNKKAIAKNLLEITRMPFDTEYQILVVPPKMNVVYYDYANEENIIVWGRESDMQSGLGAILSIVYSTVRYKIVNYKPEYKDILKAVLELAINNELYTRITGKSNYTAGMGDPTLKFLKKQIYPYWLMYLGATEDTLTKYMMRDKIAFDIEEYKIEEELSKIDLIGFIDFCIRNQKQILRIDDLEII